MRHHTTIITSLLLVSIINLTGISPAHAATAIPFTVTVSEAVTITGTPRIILNVDGNTRYATYATGSGTSSLTFTYNATVGDLDLNGIGISSTNLDLNGGTVTDLNGNILTNLAFTPPANMGSVNISYPSLSMDFIYDADGRYTFNGTAYNDLTSFLTATGGSYVRTGTATYYDSTGLLQTSAANTPRFDYNPSTLAAKGILVEGNRTNNQTYSSQLDNAAWTKSEMSVTANSGTSPDGTANADLIIPSTNNAYHHITNGTKSGTASTDYTTSIYAKAAGYNYIYVNFVENSNNHYGVFNLTTCAIGNNSGLLGYTAQSLPNGWCRFSITATSTITSFGAYIHVTNVNGAVSFTGDGTSGVYMYGAQMETGNFPTSYIPTTTASVTRGEDFLTVPVGAWYNQSAGTFYHNTSWVTGTGTGYPMLFRVDDNTSSNRWNSFFDQSMTRLGIDAYSLGAGQGFMGTASTFSGTQKIAAAQALNSSNASFNGNISTLDTTWTPPTVTQLKLYGASASKWHSTIKYFPLRASDTQLQLLTQ